MSDNCKVEPTLRFFEEEVIGSLDDRLSDELRENAQTQDPRKIIAKDLPFTSEEVQRYPQEINKILIEANKTVHPSLAAVELINREAKAERIKLEQAVESTGGALANAAEASRILFALGMLGFSAASGLSFMGFGGLNPLYLLINNDILGRFGYAVMADMFARYGIAFATVKGQGNTEFIKGANNFRDYIIDFILPSTSRTDGNLAELVKYQNEVQAELTNYEAYIDALQPTKVGGYIERGLTGNGGTNKNVSAILATVLQEQTEDGTLIQDIVREYMAEQDIDENMADSVADQMMRMLVNHASQITESGVDPDSSAFTPDNVEIYLKEAVADSSSEIDQGAIDFMTEQFSAVRAYIVEKKMESLKNRASNAITTRQTANSYKRALDNIDSVAMARTQGAAGLDFIANSTIDDSSTISHGKLSLFNDRKFIDKMLQMKQRQSDLYKSTPIKIFNTQKWEQDNSPNKDSRDEKYYSTIFDKLNYPLEHIHRGALNFEQDADGNYVGMYTSNKYGPVDENGEVSENPVDYIEETELKRYADKTINGYVYKGNTYRLAKEIYSTSTPLLDVDGLKTKLESLPYYRNEAGEKVFGTPGKELTVSVHESLGGKRVMSAHYQGPTNEITDSSVIQIKYATLDGKALGRINVNKNGDGTVVANEELKQEGGEMTRIKVDENGGVYDAAGSLMGSTDTLQSIQNDIQKKFGTKEFSGAGQLQVTITEYNNQHLADESSDSVYDLNKRYIEETRKILQDEMGISGDFLPDSVVVQYLAPFFAIRSINADYINSLATFAMPGKPFIAKRNKQEDRNIHTNIRSSRGDKANSVVNESSATIARSVSTLEYWGDVFGYDGKGGKEYNRSRFGELDASSSVYFLNESEVAKGSRVDLTAQMTIGKLVQNGVIKQGGNGEGQMSDAQAEKEGYVAFIGSKHTTNNQDLNERLNSLNEAQVEIEKEKAKSTKKLDRINNEVIAASLNPVFIQNPAVEVELIDEDNEPVTAFIQFDKNGVARGLNGKDVDAIYTLEENDKGEKVKNYNKFFSNPGLGKRLKDNTFTQLTSNKIRLEDGVIKIYKANSTDVISEIVPKTDASDWGEIYDEEIRKLGLGLNRDVDNYKSAKQYLGTSDSNNRSYIASVFKRIDDELRALQREDIKNLSNKSIRAQLSVRAGTVGADGSDEAVDQTTRDLKEVLSSIEDMTQQMKADGSGQVVTDLLNEILDDKTADYVDELKSLAKNARKLKGEIDADVELVANRDLGRFVSLLKTLEDTAEEDSVELYKSLETIFTKGRYNDMFNNIDGYLENENVRMVPVEIGSDVTYDVAYVPVVYNGDVPSSESINLKTGEIFQNTEPMGKEYLKAILDTGVSQITFNDKKYNKLDLDQILTTELQPITGDVKDNIKAVEFETQVGKMMQLKKQMYKLLKNVEINTDKALASTIGKISAEGGLASEVISQADSGSLKSIKDIVSRTADEFKDQTREIKRAYAKADRKLAEVSKAARGPQQLALKKVALINAYNKLQRPYESFFQTTNEIASQNLELKRIETARNIIENQKYLAESTPTVRMASAVADTMSINSIGGDAGTYFETTTYFAPPEVLAPLGLVSKLDNEASGRNTESSDENTSKSLRQNLQTNENVFLGTSLLKTSIGLLFRGYNTVMGNVMFTTTGGGIDKAARVITDFLDQGDTMKEVDKVIGKKRRETFVESVVPILRDQQVENMQTSAAKRDRTEFITSGDRGKLQNLRAEMANSTKLNSYDIATYGVRNPIYSFIRLFNKVDVETRSERKALKKRRKSAGILKRGKATASNLDLANVNNNITLFGSNLAAKTMTDSQVKLVNERLKNIPDIELDMFESARLVDPTITMDELVSLKESNDISEQAKYDRLVNYWMTSKFQEALLENGYAMSIIFADNRMNSTLQPRSQSALDSYYRMIGQFDADARATGYMVKQIEEMVGLADAMRVALDRSKYSPREKQLVYKMLMRSLIRNLLKLLLAMSVDKMTREISDSFALDSGNGAVKKAYQKQLSFFSNMLNLGIGQEWFFNDAYNRIKYGELAAKSMDTKYLTTDASLKDMLLGQAYAALSVYTPMIALRQATEFSVGLYKSTADKTFMEQEKQGNRNVPLSEVLDIKGLPEAGDKVIANAIELLLQLTQTKDDVIQANLFESWSRPYEWEDSNDSVYNMEIGGFLGMPMLGGETNYIGSDGRVWTFGSMKDDLISTKNVKLQKDLDSAYTKYRQGEMNERQYRELEKNYNQSALDLFGIELLPARQNRKGSSSNRSTGRSVSNRTRRSQIRAAAGRRI